MTKQLDKMASDFSLAYALCSSARRTCCIIGPALRLGSFDLENMQMFIEGLKDNWNLLNQLSTRYLKTQEITNYLLQVKSTAKDSLPENFYNWIYETDSTD
ncbi:hypothetical protein HN832_04075 [archaeon]|jgi:hypothetical protein|nr:hypothetical protein [archaeon]MBT4373428.1 hypothetical protein [archaeon]MBT4531876.1 hypothetical protein [archaeon]MBT7001543.1 hypothetical protein [archaeon]MBT7282565.1 hypothetical protein [archaeon]